MAGENIKQAIKQQRQLAGKRIALGWPKGTDKASLTYPDGTPVLLVAFWNNYGTETIPRREFMQSGTRRAYDSTRPFVKKAIKLINDGTLDADILLGQIGAKAAAIIAQEATNLREPPNAPETIERKGSSNPLVDTGLMTQSITWEVR